MTRRLSVFRQGARVLAALVVLGVVAGSLLPPANMAWMGDHGLNDKAAHALAYFTLALSTALAWPRLGWLLWFAVAVLIGGAVELAQPLVGRDADILDMMANTAGALVGAGLAGAVCARIQP